MNEERRVVSDTGPLITLEKLPDGFRFIRTLYDKILIPHTVLDELVQGQFADAETYFIHYGIVDLVEVIEIENGAEITELKQLDRGEQQAIRLAMSEKLLLLIEEEAGRIVASRLGLSISGIAGQILKAFRNDMISAVDVRRMLRVLYEAGRINKRIYEGLSEAIRRDT